MRDLTGVLILEIFQCCTGHFFRSSLINGPLNSIAVIDGCLKVTSVFTGLSEAIESSCKSGTSFFKVQKVYMPIQQVLMKDMVVGHEPSSLSRS